ncbi:MAG: ferredoxin [bacterium]|nr:ferredoxin [bacterium]
MAKIKIRVDQNICIGAASCTVVSPSVFKINDQNKAVVIDPANPSNAAPELTLDVDETKKQEIIDAARSCPVAAIFIHDEQGNQIYP